MNTHSSLRCNHLLTLSSFFNRTLQAKFPQSLPATLESPIFFTGITYRFWASGRKQALFTKAFHMIRSRFFNATTGCTSSLSWCPDSGTGVCGCDPGPDRAFVTDHWSAGIAGGK